MVEEFTVAEEIAPTIPSEKCSEERTEEFYQKKDLKNILPSNFLGVVNNFDAISHAYFDSIVVSILCLLPCLCSGATVSQEKGVQGRAIILYMLLLAPSGVGKTSIAMIGRRYLLNFLNQEDSPIDENSNENQSINLKDLFVDGASAEGLESSFLSGSSPHLVIDEFGKYASASRNDMLKQNFLRLLMQIFDSGTLVTRKLKDTKNTKQIVIKGMGLFAASTTGKSNLTPQDMRNMISDGFLNRFLVVFGQYKRIPYQQELTHKQAETVENFARKFYLFANDKHFYLGVQALEVYKKFHDTVNDTYYEKYEAQNDTAGFDIRLLTVIQRIAMLFQVCKNVEDNRPNQVEIEADSIQRAVDFLDYMYENHFDKILLYANSKDGRPTTEDRVKSQIEKRIRLKIRNLTGYLSPLKTVHITTAVEQLIKTGWAIQDEHGFITKR